MNNDKLEIGEMIILGIGALFIPMFGAAVVLLGYALWSLV